MTLDYLVRNMRSALPNDVWVAGRTVFNRLLFAGNNLIEETNRLYLHDTEVGGVRMVIDFTPDYKPNLLVLGNLAFALRTFFDKQRSHINLSLPLRISTISGKPTTAVCPVCHNSTLTIFADFLAPIPDSVTGVEIHAESLLVQDLGCAAYDVDEKTPLTARGALHTSDCFAYSLYGGDVQVNMNNQFAIYDTRALVKGLGAWANLLTGMCRAGEGVL